MRNLLSVVESFLDQRGIAHRRVDKGELVFSYTVGECFDCKLIAKEGGELLLEALWEKALFSAQIELAHEFFQRALDADALLGKVGISHRSGAIKYLVSVDLSRTGLKEARVEQLLSTLLQPFSSQLQTLEMLLTGGNSMFPTSFLTDPSATFGWKPRGNADAKSEPN